ncbi:MAG: BT_3928 family protein [Chitinophagaceae bacterium]
MKLVVNICRVFVGLLFIFSGLIKANDPLGLAYKMEEFFEIWNTGLGQSSFFLKNFLIHIFSFFHEHSLFLAVVMIAFEIIAGVALLVGWRMKLFSWLLLLLIIFFTFLTGYAYLSGKFKNCGCFGDCIPITPLTSFGKDILLTILIVFLFVKRKWITPLFSSSKNTWVMLVVTVLSFVIQWYMLNYLPMFDCLAYKKEKNIPRQMEMPENAIQDSTVISFVYAKNGKNYDFTADKFPADFDSSYKFVSRYDKIIRKGSNNEPPIKGFVLTGVSGEDSTTIVLSQPYAILIYLGNFDIPVSKWKDEMSKLYQTAKQKNIPVYIITSQREETITNLKNTALADIQIFTSDNTAIRTAARTSPCIYLLEKGTIDDKQSYHGTDKVINKITKLPVQ